MDLPRIEEGSPAKTLGLRSGLGGRRSNPQEGQTGWPAGLNAY